MGDRSKNLKDNAANLQTSVRKVLKRRSATNQLFPDTDKTLLEKEFAEQEKSTKHLSFSVATASTTGALSKLTSKMPPVREKKEKKRERWLLTRKTWKYMADAGRKLIPDGVQNRVEDIPKCERHFHNLCASEPKFILWRRKASYPGAMGSSRHSKRRLKLMLSRNQKSFGFPDEESKNADQIIYILQTYLKLDESRKTTTLLGSKTVRPDQTMSPSAQRPTATSSGTVASLSSRGPGFLPSLAQAPKVEDTATQIQQLLEKLRIYSQNASSRTIIPLNKITPEILEDKALLKQIYNELKKQQLHRILGKHSSLPPLSNLPHSSSLSSLWNFKRESTAGTTTTTTTAAGDLGLGTTTTNSSTMMRNHAFREQKKNELKLNFATGTSIESSAFGFDSILKDASDDFGVVLRRGTSKDSEITSTSSTTAAIHQRRKKQPPAAITTRAGTLSPSPHQIPVISIKKPSVEKTYNSLGTQTTFVGYNELQRLSKDYKERKRDEQAIANCATATDDESDTKGTQSPGSAHSRRKSSIDNEDVSQSVSDTIKRYLRMARKKSVHDDAANRFKRVNYDRNLRNIRAKGEINPPGMDEDNNKATQTLDVWALISLEFIRGNENSQLLDEAHSDWLTSLNQRIQQKQEYEDKLKQQESLRQQQHQQQQSPKQHSNYSAPTSPTSGQQTLAQSLQHSASQSSGIIHSSTQFLSNLWHGTGGHGHQNESSAQNSTTNSTCSINSTMTTSSVPSSSQSKSQKNAAAMQKSKSSSNIGQFVSKKIWKSRSKSQTRNIAKPEWTPQGNCVWTSSNGRRLVLSDTRLQDLTEVERKTLHRVSIDKINQLNIGVIVIAPSESGTSVASSKPQKRRQLLIKRKALTTSFFDTGNNKDDKEKINNPGGRVFGISLEKCVDNDQKTQTGPGISSATDSNYERGSRNSIISLLGGSSRGNDNIGSCESLPSHSIINQRNSPASGNNLANLSNMKTSLSQSDIRRNSQDEFDLQSNGASIAPPPMTEINSNIGKQVPALVTACINHLESEGLRCKGIFRVSTSLKRVRELKEEFDRGEINTIEKSVSAHDVATLLKQYFRDLPEPLLCRSLYQAFVKTQKIRNRRLQLEAVSYLVKLLPIAHRDTLYALLSFLAKVALNCDDRLEDDGEISVGNKMDSYNLATVFAPNILRASLPGQEPTEQEMLEQSDGIYVIRTMIDHYEQLFRVPADLMDEIYSTMIDTFPEQLNYLCDKRDIMAENYELDSASSSTPLSSPPASSSNESSYRQKVFNDYVEQTVAPLITAKSGTNSSSPSAITSTYPRRIFTREDVMHENAATTIVDDYDPGTGSRGRERSSKMKYIESDHDMMRHRQRFLNNESTGNLQQQQQHQTQQYAQPSADSHSISEQYQPQGARPKMSLAAVVNPISTGDTNENLSTRRLSSPYVLDKVGVVTASLQIPIQMQQQASGSGNSLFDETINSRNRSSGELDLSDIPYIEDSTYGQETGCTWIEGSPVTGSLMFSSSNTNTTRKNSTDSFQIPISYEGRILNSSLSTLATASDSKQPPFQAHIKEQNVTIQKQRSSTSSQSNKKHSGFALSGMSSKTTPSSNPVQVSRKSGSANEPKLTTSISNIGDAVLRSKTADFERMSHTTNTNNRNIEFEDESANIANATTTDLRSRSTSVVYDGDVGNFEGSSHGNQMSRLRRPSQGPIYKRQELISSAKRSTNKK